MRKCAGFLASAALLFVLPGGVLWADAESTTKNIRVEKGLESDDANTPEKIKVEDLEVITGVGHVIKVDDSDEFWVTLLSGDRKEIQKKLRARGASASITAGNGHTAYKMQIRNVKTPALKKKKRMFGGVSPVAKTAMKLAKDRLFEKEIVYLCYEVTSRGVPLCSIYVDRNDFGYELIINGLSKYKVGRGEHPTNSAHYRYAEKVAEFELSGVWQPYYYFLYPE